MKQRRAGLAYHQFAMSLYKHFWTQQPFYLL